MLPALAGDGGDVLGDLHDRTLWAACGSAGKPVGVHSIDGATARLYRGNGCRLVNVAFDVQAIARAARAELAVARF